MLFLPFKVLEWLVTKNWESPAPPCRSDTPLLWFGVSPLPLRLAEPRLAAGTAIAVVAAAPLTASTGGAPVDCWAMDGRQLPMQGWSVGLASQLWHQGPPA